MAQPIHPSPQLPISPFHALPLLSKKQLAEMVGRLTAEEIQIISYKIGDKIGSHLGVEAKARIELFASQKKTPECRVLNFADKSIKSKFLTSLGDQEKFITAIASPIKKTISDDFSQAFIFVEYGSTFCLSDEEPLWILTETAETLRIELNMNLVPAKYSIKLALETESCHSRKLVFSLIETCDAIEFQRDCFFFDLGSSDESDSDEY